MRTAVVLAGSMMAFGALGALASAFLLLVKALQSNHAVIVIACWLFAGAFMVMLPAFALRHMLRGAGLSVWARSTSAVAHTLFAGGCLLGLAAAVLRLQSIVHAHDRYAQRAADVPVTALLLGATVLFGLGLIVEGGFCWSTRRPNARATAVAAISGGLLLIVPTGSASTSPGGRRSWRSS
ncbi:hypothetical protein [Pseudonocardia sp. GCM10023141]|uniref:hypothetical protein n=1 Tax=Pseudonocardia sp. GCM10023141 TaxID=3252653 RepID=UPI003622ABE6